jgi:hypothetical protein
MPMSGNLNSILCMKKGWITNTIANIRDKGARIKDDNIIILKTLLVEFIWEINSSSSSTMLVLLCSFSESPIVLFESRSLLWSVEDIVTNSYELAPLKILG